ncbi:MAG: GGDEF domain-containing protein [Oscillospiraceae bacterium]
MMDDKIRNEITLNALSEIFVSLHVFDLLEDKLYTIKTNQHIEELSANIESSQDKLTNVMTNITLQEHLDIILGFTDLSTVEERMKDQNVIFTIFKGKVNGWCKARFIKMNADDDNKLRYVLFAVECIDEEKKRENYLRYLSQTDLMTGICNRGYGERMISELLAQQKKGLFCLFDVDKFKQVNDKYGHIVGDKVLIEIARILQKIKGDKDIVMRLGGDEFAAYFVDIDSEQAATAVIDRFFEEISKIQTEPMTEGISISLGAVVYKGGLTFDSIYKLADSGVYDSKIKKENSYTFRG